jgi:Acetyltransferase (GNAT) domain
MASRIMQGAEATRFLDDVDNDSWYVALARARLRTLDHRMVCALSVEGRDQHVVILVERFRSRLWRASLWPDPFAAIADPCHVVDALRTASCALGEAVYAPNVTADERAAGVVRVLKNVESWPRLASPGIDPPFNAERIWHQVLQRLGTRATRRLRRFEAAPFTCREVVASGARDVLASVETASWKAATRSDMGSVPGELDTYCSLVSDGVARVIAAFDGDRPIAHVTIGLVGTELVLAKWSYDDSYRRYSPGFYLLTRGLWQVVNAEAHTTVDLHGSPDHLKSLLATRRRPRVDLGWPASYVLAELRRERLAHDRAIVARLQSVNGVRHQYLGDGETREGGSLTRTSGRPA